MNKIIKISLFVSSIFAFLSVLYNISEQPTLNYTYVFLLLAIWVILMFQQMEKMNDIEQQKNRG